MNQKIPVLNGLRGIAILAVVLHHSFFLSLDYGKSAGQALNIFNAITSSGWLGVDLFFFLSGFVLYLPYASGRRTFSIPKNVVDFYRHRASRLLPMYFLSTLVILTFYPYYQANDSRLFEHIAELFSFTYIFSADTFWPKENVVLWSIAIEIWFSIAFPFVVQFTNKFGWPKSLAISLAFAVVFRTIGVIHHTGIPERAVLDFISDSLAGRLYEFMFGMFGAHLYQNNRMRSAAVLQIVVGAALTLTAIYLIGMWSRKELPYLAFAVISLPLPVGFLFLVSGLTAKQGWVASTISLWPLQMAGMMCYSIYLWHLPIVLHHLPEQGGYGPWALYLCLITAISWLSYRYVEFGATKNWRDLLPAKRTSPATVTSSSAAEDTSASWPGHS